MPFEGGGQGEPDATWSAAAFFVSRRRRHVPKGGKPVARNWDFGFGQRAARERDVARFPKRDRMFIVSPRVVCPAELERVEK